MSLKGDLETISLSGVLQLLSEEQKTGVLKIHNTIGEFQIILLNGSIVYAIQYKKEARLGDLLIQDGIISADRVATCLEIAKDEKLAIGKVLVDHKVISKKVLHQYLYRQFEDILFQLFSEKKGRFEYREAKLVLRWLIVFKTNTLQLIMGALKRVDELKKNKS